MERDKKRRRRRRERVDDNREVRENHRRDRRTTMQSYFSMILQTEKAAIDRCFFLIAEILSDDITRATFLDFSRFETHTQKR